MPSFDKMGVWPVGWFSSMSKWLLRNRKSLPGRVSIINAELERIGFIRVLYQANADAQGNVVVSENRMGFSVSAGSSLERLVQAYIAQGGNPYAISPFMHPDMTQIITDDENNVLATADLYPGGGVVSPRSVDYTSPSEDPDDNGLGAYRGGWPENVGFYTARQGARMPNVANVSDSIVRLTGQVREWANQDIRERLQDMEWRILKLCDLREQLLKERDELLAQAFGGTSSALSDFDDDRYVRGHLVQNLVHDMGTLLFPTDEDGVPTSDRPSDDVSFLDFTFPTDPSEDQLFS